MQQQLTCWWEGHLEYLELGAHEPHVWDVFELCELCHIVFVTPMAGLTAPAAAGWVGAEQRPRVLHSNRLCLRCCWDGWDGQRHGWLGGCWIHPWHLWRDA